MHHRPQHSSIITKTAVSVTAVFLAAIILLIFGITYINSFWMHQRILTDKQEFVSEISRSIDDQFKSLTTPLVSLVTSPLYTGFWAVTILMMPAGWPIYGK